jgi:hypothetical protein
MKNNQVVTAIIGTALIVSLIAAIIIYAVSIQSSGTIYTKGIGCAVFGDASATEPITYINWGNLPSDSSTTITVYVVNTGNAPCNYTVASSSFNPANAENVLTLTSDVSRLNAPPNSITPIALTQVIAADTQGITSYSYTITITASG